MRPPEPASSPPAASATPPIPHTWPRCSLIVSSGAALAGSPLSGGYAGAKRMQMLLAGYLQRAADARELGIRFVALAPRQFLVGSGGTNFGWVGELGDGPRRRSLAL